MSTLHRGTPADKAGGPAFEHTPNDLTHSPRIDSDALPLVATLARMVWGRKVTPKSRLALQSATITELSDLAELIETSEGADEPAKRVELVNLFLRGLKGRRGQEVARPILEALKRACLDDPGDEQDLAAEVERLSFRKRIVGVLEFNRAEFKLVWAVRRVLVMGQPAVVGAPKKSMKTTTMVDLAVSMAAGLPFLGEFPVDERLPVLMISGESGGFVIQETLRRVCDAKQISPESLDGYLFIGDELPQLGMQADLDELSGFIVDNGIKVVIVDPLYLCLLQGSPGKRLDPSNLFDVGPLLLAVSRACLDAGATPVLVHHFRKSGADPNDLPELEELAYAGIQEFARQWILLKRRQRYEPGSGEHKLWLAVGGSAGHSGEWALDISEGCLDDDFAGRRWEVAVRPASEARDQQQEAIQAARLVEADERTKARDAAVAERVKADAVTAVNKLDELSRIHGRPVTRTDWKHSLATWDSRRFGAALAYLEEHESIHAVAFDREPGGRGPKQLTGFLVGPNPPSAPHSDTRIQPGLIPDNPGVAPRDRHPDSDGRGEKPLKGFPPTENPGLASGANSNPGVSEDATHQNPGKVTGKKRPRGQGGGS